MPDPARRRQTRSACRGRRFLPHPALCVRARTSRGSTTVTLVIRASPTRPPRGAVRPEANGPAAGSPTASAPVASAPGAKAPTAAASVPPSRRDATSRPAAGTRTCPGACLGIPVSPRPSPLIVPPFGWKRRVGADRGRCGAGHRRGTAPRGGMGSPGCRAAPRWALGGHPAPSLWPVRPYTACRRPGCHQPTGRTITA